MPIGLLIGKVLAALSVALVVKILLAFGVGWVTFIGLTTLLDGAKAEIIATIGGSGFVQVITFIGLMRIDDGVSLVFAAMAIRATIKGLSVTGALRRLVFFGPEA